MFNVFYLPKKIVIFRGVPVKKITLYVLFINIISTCLGMRAFLTYTLHNYTFSVRIMGLWHNWKLYNIFFLCCRNMGRPGGVDPVGDEENAEEGAWVTMPFSSVLRDGWPYQNGWIFGKVPNGLWPSFSENHVALFFRNTWPKKRL